MKSQSIYQVDAFASQLFKGNPAAVCPLETWLSDELMLQIAQENNLSETAFYVKRNDGLYDIRWFTPTSEVDLCGHATLATAYVLFVEEGYAGNELVFESLRSGRLKVKREDDWLILDFPTDSFHELPLNDNLYALFPQVKPKSVLKGKTDYLFVFDDENQIKDLKPNLDQIGKLDARGVIVTARGDEVDFVSRFFAPQVGVDEDPVTGSAHTLLIPYWAKVLGKNRLQAMQLSTRGGVLRCELHDDRVTIGGKCVLYLKGSIYL